ncbi:MAG: cupin domain-containing protein [Alphaproteobacteria bacterium]|nr:cupin domain-containing protein [Alphaproteobacteria bacterium]
MQDVSHDYAALMLDYAAGALPPAFRLLVDVHLDLRPEARPFAAEADCVGGALLETITPAPMAATLLPPRLADDGPAEPAPALSGLRSRIALAASGDDGLAWRPRAFGFFDHRLPLEGAYLVKIPARRGIPRHTHGGEELTLVLHGAFRDDRGVYRPGDLVFADGNVEHAPRVVGDEACVCLIAETGATKLRTWWSRPFAALVH